MSKPQCGPNIVGVGYIKDGLLLPADSLPIYSN